MPDIQSNESGTCKSLWEQVQTLFYLEVDNLKLLAIEKLSVLLTRITLCAVIFIICTCVLVFLSMSISDFLLQHLAPCWTYMIVAGFYAVVAVAVVVGRRRFICDPITRFLSKVILDPPSGPSVSAVEDSAAGK